MSRIRSTRTRVVRFDECAGGLATSVAPAHAPPAVPTGWYATAQPRFRWEMRAFSGYVLKWCDRAPAARQPPGCRPDAGRGRPGSRLEAGRPGCRAVRGCGALRAAAARLQGWPRGSRLGQAAARAAAPSRLGGCRPTDSRPGCRGGQAAAGGAARWLPVPPRLPGLPGGSPLVVAFGHPVAGRGMPRSTVDKAGTSLDTDVEMFLETWTVKFRHFILSSRLLQSHQRIDTVV